MFSRITVLFFFLVADIILLANICIPHHHHHTEICIVESHCQTDGDHDEHESDGHDHDSSIIKAFSRIVNLQPVGSGLF